MYDRVFEVAFQKAQLHATRLPSRPDVPRVAIVNDIYPLREVHRRIPKLVRSYVREGGVTLICLEGAEGPIESPEPGTSFAQIKTAHPGLSAAAINVLLDRPWGVTFVGVETPQIQARAGAAMAALERREAQLRAHFLRKIRPRVLAAQVRHYAPSFATLRRTQLKLCGPNEMTLGEQVDLATRLIESTGSSGDQFPQLRAMREAVAVEHRLDFARVESVRNELVRRMLPRMGAVLGRGGGADNSEYAALRRFCVDKLEMSAEELARAEHLRGRRRVDAELDRFICTWIAKEGVRFRRGVIGHADFHGQLLELADALAISTQDTAPLRAYAAYVARAQVDVVTPALMAQLEDVQRFLSSRLRGPRVTELFELEERLDGMFAAVTLELGPSAAELTELGPEPLAQALDHLDALAGPRWRFFTCVSRRGARDVLSASLTHAKTYYKGNLLRARDMGTKTIQAMKARAANRALVIAGGFHGDTIARTLDDEAGYGWSQVTVKFELPPSRKTPLQETGAPLS